MILFCEYVIPDEHRGSYLEWVRENAGLWANAELAENTAQPGVFVELRRGSEAELAAIAQERRAGRSWAEMEKWVKGGSRGVRIWTFRPVDLRSAP